MSEQVAQKFQSCLKFSNSKGCPPSIDDGLEIYGLLKQATRGDNNRDSDNKEIDILAGHPVHVLKMAHFTPSDTFTAYAKFNQCADQIRKFTKRPPDADMLEVYALYKQATVGNINTTKPTSGEAATKWDAWNKKKGMSSDQAKEYYIAKVKELEPKYA